MPTLAAASAHCVLRCSVGTTTLSAPRSLGVGRWNCPHTELLTDQTAADRNGLRPRIFAACHWACHSTKKLSFLMNHARRSRQHEERLGHRAAKVWARLAPFGAISTRYNT